MPPQLPFREVVVFEKDYYDRIKKEHDYKVSVLEDKVKILEEALNDNMIVAKYCYEDYVKFYCAFPKTEEFMEAKKLNEIALKEINERVLEIQQRNEELKKYQFNVFLNFGTGLILGAGLVTILFIIGTISGLH